MTSFIQNKTSPSTPAPRRLSHREAADALGLNISDLFKIRLKGARLFDPSFPKISNGTFDETEIFAWKLARDNRATQGNVQPSIAPNNSQQERSAGSDRRRRL